MSSMMCGMLLGAGVSTSKTYIDDCFSAYLYTANGSTRSIVNGIDLSGEGGLVWIKARSGGSNTHNLYDTERGATKMLSSDVDDSETTISDTLTAFNSNGFTLGADSAGWGVNYGTLTESSWTFRNSPLFQVVKWTGNGSTRTISHSLKSVPGFMIVKRYSSPDEDSAVYHKSLGGGKSLILHTTQGVATSSHPWNNTTPTASAFTITANGRVNTDGEDYIGYLFAGGESTAATARSVDFVASDPDYLVTNSSSDYTFGTGDYTVEAWIKPGDHSSSGGIIVDLRNDAGQFYDEAAIYVYQDTVRLWENGDRIIGAIPQGSWSHVALVRNSGTATLYLNGISQGTYSSSTNLDEDQLYIGTNGANPGSNNFNGNISNVRVVKGTAVYTSAFKPSTEPLTSITNTVLLCCNNSSVTGTTTGTVTSSGSPTASTDSPFDDPAGFVFGENGDQNGIKCGSYVGNGSATGPEIFVGFEPQWILIRNTTHSMDWYIYDSMRGIATGGDDASFKANSGAAEGATNYIDLTPTGFKVVTAENAVNKSGFEIIYVAIRRSDGYVGKPPELGTGVFAMDTGNSSTTIPNLVSGFVTDYTITRQPASSCDWFNSSRLTGTDYLDLNTTDAKGTGSDNTWDSNTGWNKSGGVDSSWQSWMWKRHAGFDVVTYDGNQTSGRQIPHNLSKTPEMIWVKSRSGTNGSWVVGHKDLNGGTDPWDYSLVLNTDVAEADNVNKWNDQAPNSTHFTLGNSSWVNHSSDCSYIAMLFASVDGISKVGSYSGTGNAISVTTGFAPRFVIIKNITEANGWYVLDTTRGWSSGNDNFLKLDIDAAQSAYDFGAPTSTGFDLSAVTNAAHNKSGCTFIYYAHA